MRFPWWMKSATETTNLFPKRGSKRGVIKTGMVSNLYWKSALQYVAQYRRLLTFWDNRKTQRNTVQPAEY